MQTIRYAQYTIIVPCAVSTTKGELFLMMRLLSLFSFLIAITLLPGQSYAQTSEQEPAPLDTVGQFILDPTTKVPLTINLEAEEEEEEKDTEKKEKKRKKNVYYDIKTKKGYAESGYGQDVIIELFHYLKEYEEPDPYVRDIYWYDTNRKQIRTTRNVQKDKAEILHGPYQKITEDGEVLEEGIFYKGTKHGRWTRYNKDYILQDKEKYSKGWPRDSEITYYDEDKRTNMKEVTPIEYGVKEGYYYYFHESGKIAVEGEYQQDHKVGLWTEYYDYKTLLPKKQIKYPDDPFSEQKPYTTKEWNPEGQVVYEYKK